VITSPNKVQTIKQNTAFKTLRPRLQFLWIMPNFSKIFQKDINDSLPLQSSGDSRMKKTRVPLRGQGKKKGCQHKCFSCLVIFRWNEVWLAMINPIKSNIGMWISSEPWPESLQIV